MPDIIITPSSGRLEFVDDSIQITRRHAFTLDDDDGIKVDAAFRASSVRAPLNVINVTVNNSNVNYPFVLASGSAETGIKTLMMDGAGGTYNPFTNTATIDISGNSATTTLASNSSQLNGQSDSYYTNITARLGYTPVNKAGDTVSGNLTVNGNFSVNGSFTAFSASNIYLSSSVLTVEDNILTLNAFSPYLRYAGIEMYDSGSGTLSQLLWDGEGDYFFLTGSSVNGKIITGPDGQTNLSSNYIPKATAGYKLGNSLLYDNGTNIGIGTTSPVDLLSVQGNINVNYNSTDANYVRRTFATQHASGNRGANLWFGMVDGGGMMGMQVVNTASSVSPYNSQYIAFTTHEGGVDIDERMRISTRGNVGIGTSIPNTKLAVNGVSSFGPSSKLSMIGLDINSGGTPTYIKIVTTIPVASPSADFTVNIKGFVYGAVRNADISISWHYYLSTFYNPIAKSSGGWAPTIRLSAENGFVAIVLSSPGYWPKFYVESMYSSAYTNQYASGWSWTDADATGNPIVNVPYASNFGNGFVMLTDGNVGIGTTGPVSKFEMFGGEMAIKLSANTTSSFQWKNSSGTKIQEIRYDDSDGSMTLGGVGGYPIKFITSTTEKMRVNGDGNVGIGITSPTTKLHVVGVISGSSFSGAGTGLTGTASSLTAGTANSVAWTNVSSRPTTVSAFTNDSLYQYHRGDITSLSSSATNVVQPLGTFDGSNITNAPTSGWYNYLSSTHGNYLTSLIANLHRTADWYVGYKEGPGGTPTNPSWYKLLHSGNYTDYTVTKTGTGASGTWTITSSLATTAVTALNVGNGTITIAAGTGVGVGTTNTFTTNQSGATTVTVTNTGVTSNVAGTGISVSGATGAVTITNSGVTSAVAGTGVGVSGATGAVTFSIGQAVGTGNSPTFAAVTTSTDGANHIMAGTTNAEGIRMTPASSTTYPVFLRSINPGVGEASPWIYKEQATDWGIWHNNPVNSIDFTKQGSVGISTNVGGSSTNAVTVRVEMATGFVQTIAGYRNSAGTTILDNNGNITGNAATATTATTANALNTSNSYTVASLTATTEVGTRGSNVGVNLERGDSTIATLRFDADNFRIWGGGTGGIGEILRVTETGNIGIGATSPNAKVESYFSSNAVTINYLATNLNNNSPIPVYGFDVTNGSGETRSIKAGIGYERHLTNGRGTLHFYNDSTNDTQSLSGNRTSAGDIKMSIDNDGNVGIGSVTPSYKLHVMGNGYFSSTLQVNSNITLSGGGDVIINDSDGTGTFNSFMDSGIGYIRIDDGGSANGKLNINSGLLYVGASGGNVGIGSTSPACKLDVVGTIRSTTTEIFGFGASDNVSIRAASTSNVMGLYTSNSEKVRIDASGNVGIGTSNPGRKLDVEGIVRTRGASGTGGFEISAASSGAAKWRIEWDSASDSLDFNWVG